VSFRLRTEIQQIGFGFRVGGQDRSIGVPGNGSEDSHPGLEPVELGGGGLGERSELLLGRSGLGERSELLLGRSGLGERSKLILGSNHRHERIELILGGDSIKPIRDHGIEERAERQIERKDPTSRSKDSKKPLQGLVLRGRSRSYGNLVRHRRNLQ